VVLAVLGLAVSVLLACSAAALAERVPGDDWLAFHVLLGGCAVTAALCLLGSWWRLRREEVSLPSVLCVAGVAALLLALALRGVGSDPLEPWPAAAAAVGWTLLTAALALRRRSPTWALAAGFGLNLAASLLVEHAHRGRGLLDWWVTLVQVNTILGAVVALLWLAARRWLERRGEDLAGGTLLAVQVALPVLGNIALLLGPLGLLLGNPSAPPLAVSQAGAAMGWLALLLAGSAAGWFGRRLLAAAAATHLLFVLGLTLGVLVACTAARWDGGDWLAIHTLMLSWAALGFVLLAVAWPRSLRSTPFADSGPATPATQPAILSPGLFDLQIVVVGLMVLALALRGVGTDPTGPWWSAAAIVAVSALAGGLALRLRNDAWALLAAVGVNLALGLIFAALLSRDRLLDDWPDIVRAHLLACAGCVALWQVGCRRLYGTTRPSLQQAPLLHLLLGLTLVGAATVLAEPAFHLLVDPTAVHPHVSRAGGLFGWLPLLAVAAVTAWLTRARSAPPFTVAAAGLAAAVLAGCTAAHWDTGNWLAYRTLLVVATGVGFAVLFPSRALFRRAGAAHIAARAGAILPTWPVNTALGTLAATVTALALRAMDGDPAGPWWPVGVVVVVGLQAALAALWSRNDTWAFVSTMAADLAVSLLVWHANRSGADETLVIQLLQANILSGSLASLLWVAINYRVYADRPPGLKASPLLSVQAFLGLAGNVVLLGQPAFLGIIWTPSELPSSVIAADGLAGWLTLGMTAVVALVQLAITRMKGGAQVLGTLGLGAGVLLACTAAHWDHGDWLAYHTLSVSWGALAVLMLLAGRIRGPGRDEEGSSAPRALLSDGLVREWVVLAGIPVLALALLGFLDDPSGPWGSAGAVVGIGLLLALVGVWQGRPQWIFAGGLGANLAVSLVLWRLNSAAPLIAWWRELLGANVAAWGLVALLWLAFVKGEPSPLLAWQVRLGLLGNALLLGWPAVLLVNAPGQLDPAIGEAGGLAGWLALTLAGTAALLHARRKHSGPILHLVLPLGLALVVLTACSAALLQRDEWLPYHILLVGPALVGLGVLGAGWLRNRRQPAGEEDDLLPAGAVQGWCVLLCLLVLALAWRSGSIDRTGPWWSAGAILSAGLSCALLGAWRQREDGAFAAGLCLHMAASLVLWRAHLGEPLAGWWVRLVQGNLAAGSVAALVWLAAGSRFYDAVTWMKRRAPLRGLQSLVGLAGNAVLLVPPTVLIILSPDNPDQVVAQAGGLVGWLTLALALVPAAWHFGPALVRLGVPLLVAVGLGGGGLLACTFAGGDQASWPAYHLLLVSWGLTGLAAVAASWEGRRRALLAERPALSGAVAVGCVLGVIALVLGLAGRAAFQDSTGPWWSAAALLSVAATLAGLAGFRRQEAWAFAACLGVNLAVSLVLVSFHLAEPIESWGLLLFQANLIAGAAAGLLWFLGARCLNLQPAGVLSLRRVLVALLVAGNAALLGHAFFWLLAFPAAPVPAIAATGGLLGFCALLGTLAFAAWQFSDLRPRAVGLAAVGLAVGIFAACLAAGLDKGDWLSWHVLTAVAGLFGVALLVDGWRNGSGAQEEETWIVVCVAALALLVVGLGLRTVREDPYRPWPAVGAALWAGALSAGLALWRRREEWAFAGSLLVLGATALVVADAHAGEKLETWWLSLVQVSIAATAAAALFWLPLTRWLRGEDADLSRPSLLDVPVLLASLGAAGGLVIAGVALVAEPGSPPALVAETVRPAGGVSLLLVLAVAVARWFLASRPAPSAAAAALALVLPVATACATAQSEKGWLAYRVLATGWGGSSLLLVGSGFFTANQERRALALEGWAALLGFFTLALALRGVGSDPLEPWPGAAAALGWTLLTAALALRRRSQSWALVAALGLNLAASLLVEHSHRGISLLDWWVTLVQVNVIASAVTACVWCFLDRRDPRSPVVLRTLQVSLGLLGNVALLLGPTVLLVADPGESQPDLLAAGTWLGWLALLASLVAAVLHAGRTLEAGGIHLLCCLGVALAVLVAASAANADPSNGWLAYHVLLAALTVLSVAILLPGWALTPATRDEERSDPGRAARIDVVGLGVLVVALAVRGLLEDPTGPWWSAAALLATGLLAGGVALLERRGVFVYASGLLLTAAGIVAAPGWGLEQSVDLLVAGLLGLAVSGAFWSLLESGLSRWKPASALRGRGLPFAHAAGLLVPAGLLVLAGLSLSAALGTTTLSSSSLTWPALTAAVVLLLVGLADPSARFVAGGLYVVGLAGLGLGFGEVPPERWGLAVPALSLFVILAALVGDLGPRLPLPPRDGGWRVAWFLPAQGLLAILITGWSLLLCLGEQALIVRCSGPLALALLVPAALVMAQGTRGAWPERLRMTALCFATAALAALAWAWPDPQGAALWLQRNAWLLAALTVCCVVTLEGMPSWPGGRRLGLVLGCLAVLLAPVVLAQMLPLFDKVTRRTPLSGPAMAAVALALACQVGVALRLALRRGELADGLRTACVYLAEVLVVLLFLHLRLNVPELFLGSLGRYWALIVLLAAFVVIGLSELCERHHLRVLAGPLQQTGIFLPLLPILAFWARPPAFLIAYAHTNAPGLRPLLGSLEQMPWQFDAHALVWTLAAAVYGLVAVTRRSRGWAITAALAANFGFWALLMHHEVLFVVHPQAWIIPVGLILLAATWINHDRLGRDALQTMRYLGLSMIYAASTADLILAGVGDSVWLPVVLVGLALVGVFAGMLLRIRAFLFLGTAFVAGGVVALVWHAAVSRSWLWYVAGIALGVALIVLFAIFEKRREDVLRLLEQLREWE
jgi:hypothetical protein